MSLLGSISDSAKGALASAQDEARALGHGYIGTEHLLVALLEQGDTPGVTEVRNQGVSAEAARRAAHDAFAATNQPMRYVPDAELLGAIGVDLGEVRRRVEAEFGKGALPLRVGAPPLTPRTAEALQAAASRALARNGSADYDDLLAGILQDRQSVASGFLEGACDLDAVNRAMSEA